MQKVPQLAERSCREYFSRLSPKLSERGITPANVVRLRDAVYCREKNIPLLTPEATYSVISKRDDYMDTQMGYGAYIPELKGVLPDFRACNAVELSEGVLLFSLKVKGDKLLQTLMRDIASNFFDSRMNQSVMKFHQVPLFDPFWKPYVDRYKQGMIVDNWEPAVESTVTAGKSVLRNGIATGEFDLSPTPKTYWELANADIFGHKGFADEYKNREISHWLYIQEHGKLPDPDVAGRFMFAEALALLYKEDNREAFKAKAAELLKLDCPNLRLPPTKQIRHVPSMPFKKGTGLSCG